jgi:hypothetical protein
MNPEEKPSSGPSSSSLRSGRRLWTWRRLRRYLIVLVWLVTLIALFYAEENWRGRHAWGNYAQQLHARGTPTGLAPLVPKPIPDDQNFAMTPLLSPLFDFVPGTQHWRDTNAVARLQQPPRRYEKASREIKSTQDGDWARGLRVHLGAWALAYEFDSTNKPAKQALDRTAAATAVLAGLQEWAPALNEIQSAAQRPYSRFNIRYEE